MKMDELAKLKQTNAEITYLVEKIDTQFEVMQDEMKYLEQLIRQTKDLTTCL